jgi:hypothetical protein
MPYRFALEKQDDSDYASGRVFYNLPGHPAFPVRLASEIFQRCLDLTDLKNQPLRLYDPCCGGTYHLAVLAFLHGDKVSEIIASDIDPEALSVARRNLSLLTPEGLDRRIAELHEMQTRFGKESHAEALASAERLRQRLEAIHPPRARLFQADVFDTQAIRQGLGGEQVNLVITDIPYGIQSEWQGNAAGGDPVWQMLESLTGVLAEGAVAAIASTKEQKGGHERYQQVGKLKMGKRLVIFLKYR